MNRVLLDLGFVQIYWYSICIIVGMALGMFVVYREAERRKISENSMTDIIFYTILVSIIGARVYYVIFEWDYFSHHLFEMFEVWNGGLAIHGAIIFGGIFLIFYSKRKRIDTLMLLDVCAVGLILGQAIGRWGNFFNKEVYGAEVSLEYLKGWHLPSFIIEGMFIKGAYHQPLFLYESIWNLIGFVVLLIVRKRKYIKTGQIFGLYCMWYAAGRFFLEGMRVEEYNLMLGSYKVAQVVSVGMFVVGLFFFARRFGKSRFAHLYNSDIVIQTDPTAFKKPTTKVAFVNKESKEITPPPKDPGLAFSQGPVVNSASEANSNLNTPIAAPIVNVEIPKTEPQTEAVQQDLSQMMGSQPILTNPIENQGVSNQNADPVVPVMTASPPNEPVSGDIPIVNNQVQQDGTNSQNTFN